MRYATKQNYQARITSSVGSSFFKNLYFETDGKITDILQDGSDSCAFHTSVILRVCRLIGEVHATVDGTITDLTRSGWHEISDLRDWCVVVWAPTAGEDGVMHRHIGFYIGNGEVISNSSKEKTPQRHSVDFRPIEKILWHASLD